MLIRDGGTQFIIIRDGGSQQIPQGLFLIGFLWGTQPSVGHKHRSKEANVLFELKYFLFGN